MKSATIAAAAVGLAGTAAADTWGAWSNSTTSSSSVDSATWPSTSSSTSSSSTTWAEWDPATSTSTADSTWSEWEAATSSSSSSTPVWPVNPPTSTANTWSEWEASTSPAAPVNPPASTWSTWSEPATTISETYTTKVTVTVWPVSSGSSSGWNTWSSTDSAVTTKTATQSGVTTVTGTVTQTASWAPWESGVNNGCNMEISLSYGQPIWKPTPTLAVNTTSSSTWADWSSSSSSSSSTNSATLTSSSAWSSWTGSATASSSSSAWNGWTGTATASGSVSTGGWTTPSGGLTSNGDKFGMTYSLYNADTSCKSQEQVMADITTMAQKGFTSVRVYSTDCNTLEYVGSACKANNMKVILGVYIAASGISAAQPQVDDIVAWAQWDLVELIVVGNEALFNGFCSASDLAGFISSSKSAFQAAGYKGFVSTTEELSIWQSQGAALCDVIDLTAANLYAFFNAQTTADQAGNLITAQIGILETICPGKDTYVMECGWPSAGECNGLACPSPENQATALQAIQAVQGAKIVFFSFEDELWKQPGQFGVEQHWGCANVFN